MRHSLAVARHIATQFFLSRRSHRRYTLLRDLEERLLNLEEETAQVIADIQKARRKGNPAGIRRAISRLLTLEEEPRLLFELLGEQGWDGFLFLTSSYFLHQCHAYLTAHPEGHERLHFVTGVRMGAALTLDQMVGLDPIQDSAVYARAQDASVREELILMEELGHSLHGLFHSHPGRGPSATRPSSIDLATHERYERGGHALMGAIFTRDGFVRFFTHNAAFHVAVFGRGAKKVHDNLYYLEAAENHRDKKD